MLNTFTQLSRFPISGTSSTRVQSNTLNSADRRKELRELPNQTRFVKTALREAFGAACPLCRGSGRWQSRRLAISNFRRGRLPTLERAGAIELRRLVRIGRQLSATGLELERSAPGGVAFVMKRGREVLLTGELLHQTAQGPS